MSKSKLSYEEEIEKRYSTRKLKGYSLNFLITLK